VTTTGKGEGKMASRQVSLAVNNESIRLDYFVGSLVDHVVGGILRALEGVGEPKVVTLAINQGAVDLTVNEAQIPVNEFASKVISNTLYGLASCLKGVGHIESLKVDIKR